MAHLRRFWRAGWPTRAAAVQLLLGACVLPLTGCPRESTLSTAGPAASHIATLELFEIVIFLVVSAVMWGLTWYAFYRRSGSLAEHEPIETSGGEGWIAIGGVLVPFVVLTTIFVWGLYLMGEFPLGPSPVKAPPGNPAMAMKPQIRIIGHQWWWEIQYLNADPSKSFTTANELHIPVGKPVNIELETADVMHSFWIPALAGKLDLVPSQPNYIRIEASKPGVYQGQCVTFCGDEHARMLLLAVAQPPAQYQAWKAAMLQPAHEPTTPNAIAGKQVFLGSPCLMCHTVRGIRAVGNIAPDLTHIGSRRMIGSDVYPNNKAYLAAWITHAQSLKPDCLMPNLTQFSGPQLQDLVAYLRQLK